MSEALQELAGIVALKQADAVVSSSVAFGELTLVANLAHLEALVEFLASHYGVPRRSVRIESGLKSRRKRVAIDL